MFADAMAETRIRVSASLLRCLPDKMAGERLAQWLPSVLIWRNRRPMHGSTFSGQK